MVQRQLPNELLDYIVDLLLDDLQDDHVRVVNGGSLALASKRLVPFGRRLSWTRTAINCTERNLKFADELAHDSRFKHALPLIDELEFKQPAGVSASDQWPVRMVEVAEACTERLTLLDCDLGAKRVLVEAWNDPHFEHAVEPDHGDVWASSITDRALLVRLARSPMARSLESLTLRVVLNSKLSALDLGWAISKFELGCLSVRARWDGPQLEHAPHISASKGIGMVRIHDDGIASQPNLGRLLLPLVHPRCLRFLNLTLGRVNGGALAFIARFTELQAVRLDTQPGEVFRQALPHFLSLIAKLPNLHCVFLGPQLLHTELADVEWGQSPVSLCSLLDALPPLVNSVHVDGVYFVDDVGLKYFSVDAVLDDDAAGKFDNVSDINVRLTPARPHAIPSMIRMRRRIEPEGRKTLGITDETPTTWDDPSYHVDNYFSARADAAVDAIRPLPPAQPMPASSAS